jgi:hypothetical protein
MKTLLSLLMACLLLGAQLGCSDSTPQDTGGGDGGGTKPQPIQGDSSGGGGGGGSGCVDGSTNCANGSASASSGPSQAGGWVSSDHRSAQAITADASGNVTFPCNGTWCPITCNNGNMIVQVDANETGVWQDANGNQVQFTADASGRLTIPCTGQWNAI